ncbi:hypothetical protein TNCV_4013971 [Trichonephila clavipes]|nr:hypothetical protein TNCV_4013971 [Trichonephila clavipes]
MRARAYCALPSIQDHWELRCITRCLDLGGLSEARLPVFKFPQASLVLIYQPPESRFQRMPKKKDVTYHWNLSGPFLGQNVSHVIAIKSNMERDSLEIDRAAVKAH